MVVLCGVMSAHSQNWGVMSPPSCLSLFMPIFSREEFGSLGLTAQEQYGRFSEIRGAFPIAQKRRGPEHEHFPGQQAT